MTLNDNAYKEIIKAYQTTIDQLLLVIEAQGKVISYIKAPTGAWSGTASPLGGGRTTTLTSPINVTNTN